MVPDELLVSVTPAPKVRMLLISIVPLFVQFKILKLFGLLVMVVVPLVITALLPPNVPVLQVNAPLIVSKALALIDPLFKLTGPAIVVAVFKLSVPPATSVVPVKL